MKLAYVEVKNCMWCGTSNIVELKQNIDISAKGFDFFYEGNKKRKSGVKVMQCLECHAYSQKYIPTKKCLDKLYKNYYSPQTSGEKRFLQNFKKNIFKSSVLEIGGGNPGVKNMCKDFYFNLEIANCATYNPMSLSTFNVERLTYDDLLKIKKKILKTLFVATQLNTFMSLQESLK